MPDLVDLFKRCEALPIVGAPLHRGRVELSGQLSAIVSAVGSQVVGLVLDEIDLTALVRERVDVDAIAADIDIDAIIARIDLIGLANLIIEGVDLPRIIRESTNSVTAEVMTDVRTQGQRADDRVSGFVDRMLGRGQAPN
ncbi:hypothetical protein [Mycolicibacterium hodleri]|uniref:Uncharacterized protein n=1 Tax=Mycolicibacterium hodleri TaxID=49897 RepID=A0A502DXA8_9MYCO|nr:hypothetical protein [Mycolicibacterium hodleri]TPG29744.1 hypothetical protein EAH80_25825 [Mycolicibacterium hodleri]